ncbi:hypothetical protein BDU57DRAFT_512197 [Ampelomyces quisqualis]|uniref:Uncharacterized protein n=1 Tax=Ampelomyces quisqualis TaxID=50730 RepID=A0A6A5QX80_AMPQU|nr:hypothetical protein BDU57DRAFT_512197 [Ampelomyces quisqualis]
MQAKNGKPLHSPHPRPRASTQRLFFLDSKQTTPLRICARFSSPRQISPTPLVNQNSP